MHPDMEKPGRKPKRKRQDEEPGLFASVTFGTRRRECLAAVDEMVADTGTSGHGNTDTQVKAANMTGRRGMAKDILLDLYRNGPSTDEEVQQRTGHRANSQPVRRLALERAGLVERTEGRRTTTSGAEGIVFAITPAGRKMAEELSCSSTSS